MGDREIPSNLIDNDFMAPLNIYEPRNQSARTSNSRRSRIETYQPNDLSRRVSRLTCLLHRHATPRRKHDREFRFAILRPTSEFGAYRSRGAYTALFAYLSLPIVFPAGWYARCFSFFLPVFFFFSPHTARPAPVFHARGSARGAGHVDRQPRRFGSGANAPYLDDAQT